MVEQFYARVLDDDELAPYFTDADVAAVKRHQVLLLSQVLGGPSEYDGRDLGEAHRGLGITSDHYDKVVGHLVAVLTDLGADDELLRRGRRRRRRGEGRHRRERPGRDRVAWSTRSA